MNRPYASSSDDFDPYATGPHPSAGDVDREYGEGRWYLAGDPTPAPGVNPRVDRSSPLGTPHAFVSLPLSLDRPDNAGNPPAPTTPTAGRPRIDRPAPDKTDDGPGSGIAVIERGERASGGKSRLAGVRHSTYARALQDARSEQAARSARLAEERAALERAAIERAAAEQAAIERAAAERAAAERAAAVRAAAERAAADREAVERAMNAAARPHRPANDSRAPFARPANTSAPGPALPPTALPPTALPPTALPTVAAASGATNEPIRSMPTVRPIPGTGPLTLLSLAGANDTASPKSARTFRLDHGDWMPTPHNPQLFVAPSGPAIAGESNRTTIDASETIARSETTVEMRNETHPHETMASLAPQIATSPIVVASRGDVRGEEHRAAASSAPASTATKASEAIAPRPAWEVDDFRWPTLTTELLLSQGTIFDRLLKALRERNDSAKVLGVTGSRSGDGRSTLAICLARWSASQGHRTLLVDGDLLRGSLAFAAGVDFDRGWSDLEGQGLPVGEGLIRSAATPLTLLPLDPRRLDEGEYHRSARRLDTLLAELRPHFDWIVVDSGTAEELARFHLDAIPSLDAAVVVRNLQVTTPQELEAAQRHLVGIGIRQLAVAENFGRRKAG